MEREDYAVITIIIIVSLYAKERVYNQGMEYQYLKRTFEKKIRYEHHLENFKESIVQDITPFGLRIKKKPGIQFTSQEFIENWNLVLKKTERRLVEILLEETETVINEMKNNFERKLKEHYPQNYGSVRRNIKKDTHIVTRILREKREKKWRKFKSKVDRQSEAKRKKSQCRKEKCFKR